MQIRHVGILVSNFPKAIYFYVELLGFHIKDQREERGAWIDEIFQKTDLKILTIKFEEGLELIVIKEFRPIKWIDLKLYDVGISHISFTVKDLHTLLKKLQEAQIPYISSVKNDRDNRRESVFCKDFDGNYIELVEEH